MAHLKKRRKPRLKQNTPQTRARTVNALAKTTPGGSGSIKKRPAYKRV